VRDSTIKWSARSVATEVTAATTLCTPSGGADMRDGSRELQGNFRENAGWGRLRRGSALR
jgi:hypothetical protein